MRLLGTAKRFFCTYSSIARTKIVRSLEPPRDELPAEVPLTGLRITAIVKYFNRGVALAKLNRFAETLASYYKGLELDPELADAPYNAGRLNEKLDNRQGAIRHYSAYRRLQR